MADVNVFLNLLYSQVNRGIYVWGGDGQNLSAMEKPEEWIARHETTAKNAARAEKLYRQRVEDGVTEIRAFDCSGLVYWALHKLGLQKSDVSSRGLYGLCEKIEKSELKPGDLVFHHDGTRIVHVGVWANDGYQIECRGRDVGVVCNKRSASYWNRFGKWKTLEPSPEPAPEPSNKYVLIKGGSVRVRDKDGIYGRCIGIVHRGEEYPYIETAPSGWYKIKYNGFDAYVTGKPRYTEVIFDA